MWYEIAIIAAVVTWASIAFSYRLGLVDKPDARKTHKGEIPLVGGIAIFLTILAGVFVLNIPPLTYQMLLIASIVFAFGVYDDYRHLNAGMRLAVQYGSGALLATYGGIAIHNVGNLLGIGDIPLLLLTIPLSALSVAGLSNAFNMIDGIDGLAASTIALPLLILFLLATNSGHPMTSSLLLMLIPVGVFLCFNLGPNTRLLPKIFLGDGGSVTMGFMVTACLVFFSQGENAVILPVTALWLVTVPLMDMLATMMHRVRNGKKLMEADRSHLHHTLMDMGLSSRQTLALLVSYATACAMVGLALQQVPEYLSLLVYFLLFVSHCLFVIKVGRTQRNAAPRSLEHLLN